jgi:type VI secretion system VasD/TssJ family lipoprotein
MHKGSILRKSILLVLATACGVSCAGLMKSDQPDPQPVWSFQSQGIYIDYDADAKLNFFNDRPHTLVLVVYQMTATDAFNVLSITEEGLKTLLKAERFDPSVVGINNIIVQPGEKKTKVFDRVENAQWLGVVAGYYKLAPGQVHRTFRIPVVRGVKGRIRKLKTVSIGTLNVALQLGPQTILKVGSTDEAK